MFNMAGRIAELEAYCARVEEKLDYIIDQLEWIGKDKQ